MSKVLATQLTHSQWYGTSGGMARMVASDGVSYHRYSLPSERLYVDTLRTPTIDTLPYHRYPSPPQWVGERLNP